MLLGLSEEPAIGGAHGGVLLTVMGRDVVVGADLTSSHDLKTQARRWVAFTLLCRCAEDSVLQVVGSRAFWRARPRRRRCAPRPSEWPVDAHDVRADER